MRKILVLDAAQRSALAVTRAVGQLPNVHITTADAAPMALAGQSKYSHSYLQIPCSKESPTAFIQWVEQHCLNGQFDLILPVTEVTSQLLLMQNYSTQQLPMAFARYATVMELADKANLVRQAQAAGVSVPNTQFFENSQALNVQQVTYPIVLKPAKSKIYANNQWVSTTVRILKSEADLAKVLEEDTYLAHHPFMLQEFIPGHGAGVFCLYNHGIPVRYFAHQRIREKPPEGGVSVLCQSVAVPEHLKEASEKLLTQVNWHGVAMVEFRISPEGKAYLMEVNTRFWGSLQLAIDAGVNFPALLTQHFFNEPAIKEAPYKIGQRLRWLLGDVDSLYIFLKRPNSTAKKLKRIGQFIWPRLFNQRHEVNRLGDLKPAWFELKHYIKELRG
ncbi:ATP-grasp domain-containing protein [Reinekea marina]|uniref:ATP-grasp domain-containing protein n=1 Tax=Reinekea marina TaxID=1310421 RepID=A0ABV7WQL3_9GAMM